MTFRRAWLWALFLVACSREPVPLPGSASAPAPSPPASAAASADLVTAASEPADAGPSVIGAGKVDGAALRKRNIARLKSDSSPVIVLRGETARALGERICDAVMPQKPAKTPILLKPNLCGFDGIRDPAKHGGDDGVTGRTTDVEFTRGVVRCLKRRGHSKITIAEGCGISHAHWKRVIELTGYEAMAKAEGVALVALDDDGVYDREGSQPGLPLAISSIGKTRVPNLLLPKILAEHLDHGLFVTLPKIKAHRFSVTSMAIKGMQGTVMLSDARPAYKQKYRMHRELNEQLKADKAARALAKSLDAAPDAGRPDPIARRKAYIASLVAFAERMVDVLEISAPHVVLAEGAPAMGGDGFWQLYPSEEKFAIGGTNPVLVDRVGAELLGLWKNQRLESEQLGHHTSPLITLAAKRFGLDLAATVVRGDGADVLGKPRPVHFRSMGGFSIHEESSPAAGRPEVVAAALGNDRIVIDGKSDDSGWARASAVRWETDWKGGKTGVFTRARFAWSPGALFALFELESAGFFTDTAQPVASERAKLYEEDCVEIFLGHDARDRNHYLEIELGPFGHFFDLEVRRGKESDITWSSGLTIATERDTSARRATIEARLTAPEIVAVLRKGSKLPLGLYRMEGKSPRKYLAWSPTRTAKPNFHVPAKFGILRLD